MRILKPSSFALLAFILSTGCAGHKLKLHEWTKLPPKHYTLPPYAKHLGQFKIALDPGHGGMSHLEGYKRGPTGKQEAVMNLNVAFFLKEFLEKTGAKVVMTRARDTFVSLKERVEIAENADCDFLISLHHNASENSRTNYASVYYHLHPDYSPMSMDLARQIYFGLVEALRLPQVADDGLLTDKLIYPAGFGLLRQAKIPAILLESSFFSNPDEEKRLTDLEYNRREAYGIFLGLARWAAGGIPSTRLLLPTEVSRDKRPEIVYELKDGITERGGRGARQLLIYSNSVTVQLDGKPIAGNLDLARRRFTFQPDSALTNGAHPVRIDLQNLFKNHNLPVVDTVIIASPTRAIRFDAPVTTLPADGAAVIPIAMTLYDSTADPAWDGTKLEVASSDGRIAPAVPILKESRGVAYYQASQDTGQVLVIATADGYSDTLQLTQELPGRIWVLSGVAIDDSTRAGLAEATISIDDSLWARTDENGGYFILNAPLGEHQLAIAGLGYAGDYRTIIVDSMKSLVASAELEAHFDGLLHNEVILLDAALGIPQTGDRFGNDAIAASANLALVEELADTLTWAGALPIMIRKDSVGLSTQERIQMVNSLPNGWYLKFGYRYWDSDSVLVQTTIYPANQTGEQIARAIHAAYATLPMTRTILLQNTSVPEVTNTNKTAIEVIVKCREPQIAERDLPALFKGLLIFKERERLGFEREGHEAE